MKKLILLFVVFFGTGLMFAQTEPTTKKGDAKEDRTEKKMIHKKHRMAKKVAAAKKEEKTEESKEKK